MVHPHSEILLSSKKEMISQAIERCREILNVYYYVQEASLNRLWTVFARMSLNSNQAKQWRQVIDLWLPEIDGRMKGEWIEQRFYLFLGLHPRHMDVPRLGVELEL